MTMDRSIHFISQKSQTDKKDKWYALYVLLIFATFLAFLFILIGHAIPDWIHVRSSYTSSTSRGAHSISMSIWYDRLCPDTNEGCQNTYSHGALESKLEKINNAAYKSFVLTTENLIGDKLLWEAWETQAVLSIVLALFGFCFAVAIFCLRQSQMRLFPAFGFFIMIASCVLIMVPVVMIADILKELDDELYKLNMVASGSVLAGENTVVKSPSGLILAGVGAMSALVAAFVFLCILYHQVYKNISPQRTMVNSIRPDIRSSASSYNPNPLFSSFHPTLSTHEYYHSGRSSHQSAKTPNANYIITPFRVYRSSPSLKIYESEKLSRVYKSSPSLKIYESEKPPRSYDVRRYSEVYNIGTSGKYTSHFD